MKKIRITVTGDYTPDLNNYRKDETSEFGVDMTIERAAEIDQEAYDDKDMGVDELLDNCEGLDVKVTVIEVEG